MRRTALCTLEPNKCQWNQSDFCIRYPKYCIKDQDPMNAVPRQGIETSHSFEYLNAVGQREEDLLNYCTIEADTDSPCINVVSQPAMKLEGFPNMCFTVESLWGQPDAQPRSIPVTAQVSVRLELHPEEYVVHKEPVKAHVLVHDPRALDNPNDEGLTLLSGKTYIIYLSQTVTKRQPAPFRTNCTDYLKLWRENGGRGPLTRKSCSAKCKMERSLQSFGCVPLGISYPNNNTLCNFYGAPSEIRDGCSRECADACTENTYHLRVEIQEEQSLKCPADDINCKQQDMMLFFSFNRFEVTTFMHEPKFESVSVFSYIGGYVGMWLGVSLVALFDLAETLVNLLVIYPLSQASRRKARVA
ncbi:hypothetical protein JTE90_009122 [Oedothorax gibbosus]|uniref:Uncharacterized protein n=1 Tax=Oedothorax gibbosus TaxID=931172 RepID=A0AAV6TV66_9ARAC|nr:hypothetical protein JTE90_009122 [Oedothorax gibbosus]